MKAIEVLNLSTGDTSRYLGITPREAVIAAHAQNKGDFNTWDYQTHYGHLVKTGLRVVTCGDHTAIR